GGRERCRRRAPRAALAYRAGAFDVRRPGTYARRRWARTGSALASMPEIPARPDVARIAFPIDPNPRVAAASGEDRAHVRIPADEGGAQGRQTGRRRLG